MANVCLRGGIRTTQHGNISIYLFPSPGEGREGFTHLENEELERIFVDHFLFFRSGKTTGKVNGRTVTVGLTRKEPQRRIMRFPVGFMNCTILEDPRAPDDTKATLFIDLPFVNSVGEDRYN